MKQVQKMSQETDAIQYNNFDASRSLIDTLGIVANFSIDHISRNKNIVINSCAVDDDLLQGQVNIVLCYPPGFHFITRNDPGFVY